MSLGLLAYTLTIMSSISLTHSFVIHVPSSLVKRIIDYESTKTVYVGRGKKWDS